jgi:phosphoribosylaminoimidazolecarboxamide formyltransferase/IMP cyclohydrolase
MPLKKRIRSALISVFHKDGLTPVIHALKKAGVTIYATGGTQDFIENAGAAVIPVENITDYPSILGGRVKTLHPKVFGGILGRRSNAEDLLQLDEYQIPVIDLVIVDLYPFEATVASGADEESIIEKIDIGGISLIRAAAKNFNDVLIIPSLQHYGDLLDILEKQDGESTLEQRKTFAVQAFAVTSYYDTAIFNWFNQDKLPLFRKSFNESTPLRYGENPHQEGIFFGRLNDVFNQLHGKELSYNNLLDIEAAISLMADFSETTFAIIKHNNACGIASAGTVLEAWTKALACDPVSAFGGILITNRPVTPEVAIEINKLFFEVLIAPAFDGKALDLLKEKKNRILLQQLPTSLGETQFRSLLNGVIQQQKDLVAEIKQDMKVVTEKQPSEEAFRDMAFANRIVKHSKSNAIVLAKNSCLLASGVGQTSRVDALKQAIEKAVKFNFKLEGAVMASDAFFPFPDCVEIAHKAGIKDIIQPGGSIKDKESIDYCNKNGLVMVLTGNRHFKH